MPISLSGNSYGKSRVRLLKLTRQPDRHDVKDLTVGVQFQGDFESSFVYGDNTRILPTDTIRNTVYAFARLYSVDPVENFGRTLAEHFLNEQPQISQVRVNIAEQSWRRVPYGGKPHASSFTPGATERRSATVNATRTASVVEGGIENPVLMRTAGAGFENYLRDPLTTLQETEDRILAATADVSWTYSADSDEEIPFNVYWYGVRVALIQTFVEHDSKSVQHTLYAMADAVLERYREISAISLSVAARSCAPVDLSPFGLGDNNEVFLPLDDPRAIIDARVQRDPDSRKEDARDTDLDTDRP
jgi:urate oxidase